MANSSRSWWEQSGEDMVNIVFIIAIALATLWAIYIWLALPFQAPISFLIGFVAVAGYSLAVGFRGAFGRGQSSTSPPTQRPLSAKLSHFAFVLFAAIVFGSWGGGFLALIVTVIAQGGISSDCSPGVPMRYC